MAKLKKILLMGVSYALIAALAIGGTLAYLKDEDSAVNVMTLGNVSIEQIEQEWNAGETALQDFTQAKPLYPYVGSLGWENITDNGGAYRRFTMNNVVDKYVSVKNTGKSDAYVRTIIALEMGDFSYADLGKIIGASTNNYNGSEFQFPGAWDWTDDFVAEIDGKNYNIMVAVHKDAIEPGETTIPSLLQVYMNKDATNEDCEKIDGNDNGTYDILVVSQAVQANGFDDAETALNAGFGDITTTNHPWSVNPAPAPKLVKTVAELQKALDDAVVGDNTIILGANIEGNVTITQKNGVKIFLDGADNTFNGVMTVFGNGRKATAGLTIKNVNFVAANGAESCIVSPDRKINNAYSYSSNVTVEGCTFTDPDGVVNCAAVRHQDGGDSNWKIIDCVVDNTMHSLVQVNNVELDGLYIQGCEVYSKNGINLNQCTKVTIVDCTIDVKGYAVRYGVNGATVNGTFAIKDSTLKSANDDGDAVIIFRGTMTGSTLTITNTTLTGTPEITGNANVVR